MGSIAVCTMGQGKATITDLGSLVITLPHAFIKNPSLVLTKAQARQLLAFMNREVPKMPEEPVKGGYEVGSDKNNEMRAERGMDPIQPVRVRIRAGAEPAVPAAMTSLMRVRVRKTP